MLPVNAAAKSSLELRLGDARKLPKYLTEEELNRLTVSFQSWFDQAPGKWRKNRARHWAVFLTMRFSGARLGEVIQVDDTRDIHWREGEIRVPTLKRRQAAYRTVFLPQNVLTEISRILAEFPELRGRLLRVHPRVFRRVFAERAREAGIQKELAHPHVLRHSRAIEMIRAGVPLSLIQQLLGHAFLSSTAVYLQVFQGEARRILQERGLI